MMIMIMMWRSTIALAILNLAARAHADTGPYIASDAYDNGEYGPWPTETYRSTSLLGPAVNFVQSSPLCKDGQYTLLALRGEDVANPGPTIFDHEGNLVWTKRYGQTYNLNIYSYRGKEYLTFWEGDDTLGGHGDGVFYMLDSSYNEAYKIRGPNGLPADLHEFQITRNETALFTVYDAVPADLRSVDGPAKGWVWDGTFVEVDVETGELLFEWRALDHFDFAEVTARTARGSKGESYDDPWDFFHISSVDKDAKGNFLVSALYADSLVYVDGGSGDILWRLGGKDSDFEDLSDGAASNFTAQHHARFRDNDTAITLFDASNGSGRGLYLDLDLSKMTVKLRHEYNPPPNTIPETPDTPHTQGSVQLLDSGNILLSYGLNGAAWTEFSIDGTPLCHAHFGPRTNFGTPSVSSYRVAKHPWIGTPHSTPDFEISNHEATVSWNGATEVATWVLEGANAIFYKTNKDTDDEVDPEPSHYFTFLSAVPKSGFETVIPIPRGISQRYLRLRALSADGDILGTSSILPFDPNSEESVVSEDTDVPSSSSSPSPSSSPDNNNDKTETNSTSTTYPGLLFLAGFITNALLIILIWFLKRYFAARRQFLASQRGGWTAVDDIEPSPGSSSMAINMVKVDEDEDEDAEQGRLSGDSDTIEFSLLGNPRLSPRASGVILDSFNGNGNGVAKGMGLGTRMRRISGG